MAPPQVKLANKQPPPTTEKPVEEKNDVPTEANAPTKGEALTFPAIINVETERRANLYRNQARQRRYRPLMCGVALIIVVTVATLGTMAVVHRMRMRHRKTWECAYGADRLPETVSVDHEARVITAEHHSQDESAVRNRSFVHSSSSGHRGSTDHPSSSGHRGSTDHPSHSKITSLRIIHAYRRALVAYKDLNNNTCYIDRLDETFEEGYARYQGYETSVHPEGKALVIISRPIQVEVLRHIADVHIFEHCENSVSVWAREIDVKVEVDAARVVYI